MEDPDCRLQVVKQLATNLYGVAKVQFDRGDKESAAGNLRKCLNLMTPMEEEFGNDDIVAKVYLQIGLCLLDDDAGVAIRYLDQAQERFERNDQVETDINDQFLLNSALAACHRSFGIAHDDAEHHFLRLNYDLAQENLDPMSNLSVKHLYAFLEFFERRGDFRSIRHISVQDTNGNGLPSLSECPSRRGVIAYFMAIGMLDFALPHGMLLDLDFRPATELVEMNFGIFLESLQKEDYLESIGVRDPQAMIRQANAPHVRVAST